MRLGMGLGLGNLLSGQPLTGFPNDFSFNFDGSNDYLDCGFLDDFVVTNNISVSLWFNASGIQDFDCFFSQRVDANNILKAWYHGSNIVFEVHEGGTKAGRRISWTPDSNWHHLVFSFDTSDTIADSKVQIYLDGALPTQTDIGGYGNSGSTESFRIGSASNDNYFTGKIDEFAFWNAVLSASDVTSIYNNGKVVDFSKSASYAVDRTANLKLWLRCGDKVLPEEDTSIARSDFYTDFDGTNDYVDCGADVHDFSSGDFTILGWIYHDTANSSNAGIVGVRDSTNTEVQLWISPADDKVYSWNGSTNVGSSSAIADEVWTHVAMVQSGSNKKFYINGALDNTASQGHGTARPATFKIGFTGSAGEDFQGKISSISVYKTELDAQTIKQFSKSRYISMRDNRFSVVDFDGSNDYIDAPITISSATDCTVSAWVFLDATGADRYLADFRASSGTGYIYLSSANPSVVNKSSGTIYVNGSSGTTSITAGTWNHICVTGISIECSKVIIGSHNAVSAAFWNGKIASLSVYNTVKDAYALYQKGITYNESSESGLVGLWRMGSGAGDTFKYILDQSSNNNNGAMTNMTRSDISEQMVAGYDLGSFTNSTETTLENVYNSDMSLSTTPSFNGVDFSYYSNTSSAQETSTIGGRTNVWKIVTGSGDNTYSAVKFVPNPNQDISNKQFNISVKVYIPSTDGVPSARLRYIYDSGGNNTTIATTTTTDEWVTLSTSSPVTIADYNAWSLNIEFVSSGVASKICYIDDYSITSVLQSADLSDTYPAIIDVNEPVLGVNAVDNNVAARWIAEGTNSDADITNGVRLTFGNNATGNYAVINDALLSTSGLTVGKIYKTIFTASYSGGSSAPSVRLNDGTNNYDNVITTTATEYEVYFKANSEGGAYLQIINQVTSNVTDLINWTIQEVSGNPGNMTNQATSDLVYSSVLPDQSFLTGVNSAYNFIDLDGSDEYIAHSNISFTGAFSISSWINLDNVSSGRPIVGDTGNDNWFKVVDADTAGIRIAGGTATEWDAGMTFPTGSWAYVAVVRNASNEIIVYVNGVAYTSNQPTLSGTYVLNALGQKGNGQYFDGKIGQIALYNKALSSIEVGAIYTLGRHGNLLDSYSDNLKGYWAMSALDASTGLSDSISTIYDRSGNSNHGTPTNADAGDLASSPNAEPNGYAKQDSNRTTTIP